MNPSGYFKSSVLDAVYEVNSSGVLQPRTTNEDFKVQGNGTGKFFIHGLQYPTADGTAKFPIVTNGSGVLSLGQIVPGAVVFPTGTEGSVLFVDNTSPNNGIAADSGFLYSSTLFGVRLGQGLTDNYNSYGTNFLSRFWATSISGFLATFILEHIAGGAAEQANFIFGRANGSIGSRADISDTEGTGAIFWQGYKTGTYANCASIQASVDGTPAIFSIPGRLQFGVTKAGDFLTTVVLDIRSDLSTTFIGGVGINTSLIDQDTVIGGNTDANLGYFNAGEDSFVVGANTSSGFKFRVVGSSSLDGAVTVNEAGASVDFRIEGDTDSSLGFFQGSTDRFGVGTNAPDAKLHVVGTLHATGILTSDSGRVIPPNIQTGATYTILVSDYHVVGAPAAGGTNHTLPASAAVGTLFHISTGSAVAAGNTFTLTAPGGETVNGAASVNTTRARNLWLVQKMTSTTWQTFGT